MSTHPVKSYAPTEQSNPLAGLSRAEAASALLKHGRNLLPEPTPPGVVRIFARQFRSPFIYVLLVAAAISFALGQTINSYFIFAVLLINASIGSFQEYAAERAAGALRKLVPNLAAVIREGRRDEIDSSMLVPDDVVVLESGAKIPADLRLISSRELVVDESMLTGESLSVAKTALNDGEQGVPDSATCYAGTVVNRGRGIGRVIATGARTQIGTIAADIGTADVAKPPLVARVERFTLIISYAMVLLIAVIFAVTLARGDDLSTVFLLGVALMVSAIPEGLPAAITVALAIGMRRMAKVNVIIRKLAAVESLGSCTYIAADKTGTLTVNELTVRQIVMPDGRRIPIDGEGEIPEGDPGRPWTQSDRSAVESLARAGALANEAVLIAEAESAYRGDAVDVAFLVLAGKVGMDPSRLRAEFPELDTIPYESENAFSASVNRCDDGVLLQAKGALETVLPMCSTTRDGAPIDREALVRASDELAGEGYRVLAVAAATRDQLATPVAAALHDLGFLGLVGIADPVRPEAVDALQRCREARIVTAMITGDHPHTALSVAHELGLEVPGGRAVTGADIENAEREGTDVLDALVTGNRVFARISPLQKRTIVDRLIHSGENVAVTGDGVNDAPALHHAHVGVAMGKHGTDVARESADLILTDDNFSSIVNGIREGRIVYNNIRKVIFLLISTGAAEITLFMWSLFLGLPLPLFPLQLLWLNLVTNGVQDVALAFEPAEGDELKKPPRAPGEAIFDPLMIERVLLSAVYMGTLAFAVFYVVLRTGVDEDYARNVTLLLMVLFENVHALNSRSEKNSLTRLPFFGNPLLVLGIVIAQGIHIGAMYVPGISTILQIEPVSVALWAQLLAVAATLFIVDELHKLRLRRHGARKT